MSRSHRYSPICSLLKVDSERFDKQRWHRAWRARQRAALNAAVRITEAKDVEEAFDDFNLILPREVSNIWKMEKEGKVRFSPVKYRSKQPATNLWTTRASQGKKTLTNPYDRSLIALS